MGTEDRPEGFALSIWSARQNGINRPTGKSFTIGDDGNLVKGPVSLWVNEMSVVRFSDLEGLSQIIEDEQYSDSYITYGLTENWEKLEEAGEFARVTLKYESDKVKQNSVQRTNECLSGQSGIGGYFLIDFDSDGCPWEQIPSDEDILEMVVAAAKLGGLDIEEVECLTYKSSSSSLVKESDGEKFDKGGRHLIFLVDDIGDLQRFADSIFTFLTISGYCYGKVSKCGGFLKRGILDRVAIRCTQPTFMTPVNCGPGLRVEREISIIEGSQISIDTQKLRDPTPDELEIASTFWSAELSKLRPAMKKQREIWIEQMISELIPHFAEGTPRTVLREIVVRRLNQILVGSDRILMDNGKSVRVVDILANPSKYNKQTCSDPVDLDKGKNTAIIFANESSGQPILFSQAHGGISYKLLFDGETLLEYIEQICIEERIRQVKRVMRLLYTSDDAEAEYFLKKLAKLFNIPKKVLLSGYSQSLKTNRIVRGQVDSEEHDLKVVTNIDSVEYQAARELLEEQAIVSTSGSGGYELWLYTGKYWRYYEDAEAQQALTNILSKDGWNSKSGSITRTAHLALSSLKVQSFQLNPPFRREVQHIINCKNGEVWILPSGKAVLRPHSSESGLTYVLEVDYDPEATSQLFFESIVQIFLPPAHQFNEASEKEQKHLRAKGEEMAHYIIEILAYLLVPKRWLTNWFLFIGNGSNGKTILLKILQLLIPEESVVNERLELIAKNDFGMARIRDKVLLIDDDLVTGTTLPDDFLKKTSESKRISANVKHNPRDVSFNNRCAVVVLTNNYPRLKDLSIGTIRRIRAIEFSRRFYSIGELTQLPKNQEKKYRGDAADLDLLEKLVPELPGILNILVHAYTKLRQRGDFEIPISALRTTDKVIRMAHPLKQFIKEYCTEGEDRFVRRTEFQSKLNLYNREQENNWRPSIPQIKTEMEQLGYRVTKKRMDDGTVPEVYCGIALKDSPPISLVPETPIKKKVK